MIDPDDIFEEALEFGLSFEAAELVAPFVAGLHNDPRGFRRALVEDEPQLAARLGWLKPQ